MIYLIPIIAGVLIWLLVRFIISKSKIADKGRAQSISTAIIVSVVALCISFIPRNINKVFDSPEEAYLQSGYGKAPVKLVVNGQNCALVVGGGKNTDNIHIVPKTAEGWKAGRGIDTKSVSHHREEKLLINVFRYKDTADYFIRVEHDNGEALQIADSAGSSFLRLDREDPAYGTDFFVYYASVYAPDEDYRLIVNGVEISLF